MQQKTIESDVVVVGLGIAGAMVAYRLASRGRRVALIEQGVRLDRDLIEQVFSSESFIGHPRIPQLKVDFYGDLTRGRPIPSVAGGLARFYSGVSLRMREREFDRWPFPYSEIEPYYTQAEGLMRVSGNRRGDPCEPLRSGPHPLTLPPMSDYSKRLYGGAVELGLSPFQHPFAIDFDMDCVRCNHCNQVPCSYNSKWDPDSFIAKFSDLPIDVWDRTSARKIQFSSKGPDRRVEFIEALNNKSGEVIQFRAKSFVLAGGSILTPKLMMRSGLRDVNPLVGTHLMTHCLGLVVGFFPYQMSTEGDFHKWWSVSDYYFEDDGNVRGLIQQDHLTARRKVFSKIPKFLHPVVSKFYYNTCQILVIAEDEPRRENRIELSQAPTGAGVVLHQKFTQRDESKRAYLAGVSKKIMRRAGALAAFTFKGKSIYHACGTARMGKSISESVTDDKGCVWGTDNLYVADASLFPTSSGVNPSLSIAANALRVADLMP